MAHLNRSAKKVCNIMDVLGPVLIGGYGLWMVVSPRTYKRIQAKLNVVRKEKVQSEDWVVRSIGVVVLGLAVLLYLHQQKVI